MVIDNYEVELAEENAVAHVQAMAIRLLDAKKISRTGLAELMGVSGAHISQLLGDQPRNLSVRKAARLFHALGEKLVITCPGIEELDREAEARHALAQMEMDFKPVSFNWAANSNNCDPREDVGELLAA